jgi:transcriptional regulator with XRE-family HTH domain
MRFRNRVREIRLSRGLSVAELSRQSGVSKQTIFTIEADEGYGARAAVQLKLAITLNETLLFWIEREASDPPPDEEV